MADGDDDDDQDRLINARALHAKIRRQMNETDRDGVTAIRNGLISDPEFVDLHDLILKIIQGDVSRGEAIWTDYIMRVEARKIERDHVEIRARLEEERKAAEAAERAELESISGFGMF